jgi:magnesium-transporting ATPase (P-type)
MFGSLGVFSLILLITTILCLVFAFYPDIGHWQHAAFAGLILIYIVPFAILLHWQRTSYLEPKIKIIIVLLALLTIISCGVALAYVFGLTYPGQDCFSNNPASLFRKSDGKCFKDVTCMEKPFSCVAWGNDLNPRCGRYNFTTKLCIT